MDFVGSGSMGNCHVAQTLGNVLAITSRDCMPNGIRMNIKSNSKGLIKRHRSFGSIGKLSNFYNLIDGQFFIHSAFQCGINLIICTCSDKQMIGIYARRIVTAMKNFHSSWNWTIDQLIRKAVSKIPSTMVGKAAIAFPVQVPSPEPTGFSLIDSAPKVPNRVQLVRVNSFWHLLSNTSNGQGIPF